MKLMAEEKVLHELRPSCRLLGYWIVTRCVPASLAVGALIASVTYAVGMMPEVHIPRTSWRVVGAAGLAGALVVLALATAYAAGLLRTYRYYVTDQRCVFCGGILLRVRRSVPYHKVTDLEERQNIVERIFGIWQLGVYTPGTSSYAREGGAARPEVVFRGLRDPDDATDTIARIVSKYTSTGE